MHVTVCREDFQECNVKEFLSYLTNKYGGKHKDLQGTLSRRRFDLYIDVCVCLDAGERPCDGTT